MRHSNPRTCEYATLHGFAGVIKGMDLEMGRYSWIVWVGPMSSRCPYKRESKYEKMTTEQRSERELEMQSC